VEFKSNQPCLIVVMSFNLTVIRMYTVPRSLSGIQILVILLCVFLLYLVSVPNISRQVIS
jgi:hypothetical protein